MTGRITSGWRRKDRSAAVDDAVANSRPKTSNSSSRKRRVIHLLSSFFLGHGAQLGVQVLTGFMLLRWLSIEAYAQFSLAYGFQLTLMSLMDLGFTSTIVPLVGEKREDKALVGRYVRAAKYWRDLSFWVFAPFTCAGFLYVMHKHQWNWWLQIGLASSVLLTLHSSGRVSCFSAPLFLFRRLKEYYVPQTITALLRVLSYLVLYTFGLLGSFVAAGLSALIITVNGVVLKREAAPFMEWPNTNDRETNREVLRYILPAIPAIAFSAFQAQISLFLVSIFGGTTNIAEVAALGRLGQIFTMLMTFNIMVIEPYMARREKAQVLPAYLGFIAATVVICIPLVLIAFRFPMPFLWLLGNKYMSLTGEIGWVVMSACISHLAGLIWIMNRSRKWVFWSGTAVEIGLLLAAQISFLFIVGVRTTHEAVMFNLISSFCYIVAHGYVGLLGFFKSDINVETTQLRAI
ncbi:lipopolysaccharide biosynthesis protein [Acidicapsa dinghuensis]|uniref:Lipopolysaccharide biosynthesis protein n=1 Tax=Acidicapsa dinghuensis TaxID=2218256 RepID=A0ABW1EJF6_9BACT|nr:oligosaccharide flippase family protein [Acidicapsa dinghuensis]